MNINLMSYTYKKLKQKYQPQFDALLVQLQPIKDYWKRLSERDQQILVIGGAVVIIFILFSIISMAVSYREDLKDSYIQLEKYKIEADIIASSYKSLSNIMPNDFSSVNSDRIKDDATQILEIKDADIILADNTLTIKASNVKFEATMLFLDQLRKSYGLFPSKLKITRLPQSGYVAFSVTFTNVEQS